VQAAEAKARRKEEKKSQRAQQKAAAKANETDGGADPDGSLDGIAPLSSRTNNASKSVDNKTVASGASGFASTTEASGVPPLLTPDLPHLAAVLDKADVVIEVLDARDPLAYRSQSLETRVASKDGQKLLIVLNKIGACCFCLLCSTPLLTGLLRYLPPRANGRMGCPPPCPVSDTTLSLCLIYAPICKNT
jgi:nuclear GTP-binding protein